MAEWRVGPVGRTLYRDGELVGEVETPEIAAEIVETMNRTQRLLDEVRTADTSVDGCECDECAPPCTTPGCCGNPPAPPDAERRSEATPQKDLPLLVDEHDGCQF